MLASTLIALLVGCEEGSRGAGADGENAAAGKSRVPAHSEKATVPPLPIEKYLLDTGQELQLMKASKVLITHCMAKFGFDYVGPSFNTTENLSENGTNRARRYGVADVKTAKEHGYHLPGVKDGNPEASAPRMSDAEIRVFIGDADPNSGVRSGDRSNGKVIPKGGCSGEAMRKITTDTPHDLASEINKESQAKSLSDPEVVAVFAAWSSCMKGNGYSYTSPTGISEAVTNPGPERTEIATAVADVECKKKTNLISVWHGVESRIQNQMIGQKEEALGSEKRHMQAALKIASQVLEETS
ncbi:hypothetical protein [Streptomyces sp. NBC_00690]|uniref:hypothetical protein n=1 Tax=Streptomyces sp. NBC_00690 TaxID=2975808 RepID=UPI002E27D07C|nr:hypothetical protein [Streptomyces sp. NBC_00690]